MKKKTNKIGRKFKNTYNESRQRFFIIPLTFRKGLKLSIVEMKRMIIYKRWQYVALSVVAVFIVTSSMFLYQNFTGEAATYGWLQTDWSGGASATTATHTNNQTSWNQYTSKTANLSTADGVLTQTSASPTTWTETADADFSDNGTYTDTYNDNGSVRSKKASGVACTTAGECLTGRCSSNLCKNIWLTGPCAGISVYYLANQTKAWKTSSSDCIAPHCLYAGTYPDYLSSDNSINYTAFPARDHCKALGARLPTSTELICISDNRASYENIVGVSFSMFGVYQYYWTNQENAATTALTVSYLDGLTTVDNKSKTLSIVGDDLYFYAICVK